MLGSKLDIFNQQWIDVVFAGRNKAYGAYELRKDNGRNAGKALLIAIIVFVVIISANTIINFITGFIPKAKEKVKITNVVLAQPPPDLKKPPPPPPPEPPKPKVDQVKFPPPVVKPDVEVKEKPPTIEDLKVADPGQKNLKGDKNADVTIDEPVGNSDVRAVRFAPPMAKYDNEVLKNTSAKNFTKGLTAKAPQLAMSKVPGALREDSVELKASGFFDFRTGSSGAAKPIIPRTNFNETAFFYPQLRTNEKGEIAIEFTIPEA